MSSKSRLLARLLSLDGIGPVAADKLIDAGLTDFADLSKPKFNKMLSCEAALSVRYNICRSMTWDFARSAIHALGIGEGVGSFRRGCNTIRDLDILTTKSIDDVVCKIERDSADPESAITLVKIYKRGMRKMSMLIRYRRRYIRVDVFSVTEAEVPFALLAFTGSALFNIKMRTAAKAAGFKLNAYEITRAGVPIAVRGEADIFKLLNRPWVAPGDRI